MGLVSDAFSVAFRDFVTSGIPASGPHEPVKSEVRGIGTTIEQLLALAGIAGSIYPDTSAGIAATTDGQLFLVQGAGDNFALLYKNVSGAAVDQNISLPSARRFDGYARSGTFADRDAIPLDQRERGLRFLVTENDNGTFQEWREYEWRLAGDRNGPTRTGTLLTAPQWCALWTEREKLHFDIVPFQGTLPAANVEQLPTALDNIADLTTAGIASFRATALTGGNTPLVELSARLLGLKPDTIKVAYGGVQLTIPGLPWRPKDQAAVKDFFVSGNSIDDATDVPMWHTILAARRGVTSHFTARYSSDKHQLARAGLDPTILTFAGNTLPAGGTSKLVASLNGNSPIDINADYALLSTGDASLTTGVSLHGVIVDATNSRPGTLSAPNAASAAYSFTQDAGLPAITLSGPVTFIPDLARFPAASDNFCGIGQNFFYSGVPGAFGDHTALTAYEIIDRFAAAADGNRFLIRDVLPSADWPAEGSPAGPINGVDYGNHQYSAMNAFNARNEARHPGSRARSLPRTGYPNGLTLLQFLQTRGNGSANDNADIAAGLTPRSLRLDGLHPNLAGQTAMADFFDEAMQAQKLATYDLTTSFTLSVTGTQPAIYPDEPVVTTASAVAQIERGPTADLADQISGALTSSAYYPTLSEAINDLDADSYFNSDDQDNEGPHAGVRWIYKVTSADPFYDAVREWAKASDVGLSNVDNTSDLAKPISDEQQAAFTIKSRALACTSSIPEIVNYITTGGFAALGDDGGGAFVRTATPQTDGAGFQSADGSWWKLVGPSLNVKMFGAIGDGIADDTEATQKCANRGADLIFPPGGYKFTGDGVQLRPGQKVVGFNATNFNDQLNTLVFNDDVDGGCFWYTQDNRNLTQVMMPGLYDIGLRADFPLRFNDERTAVIGDSTGNVPFGMKPVLRNVDIKPRVFGVGIGVSWTKMFDGEISLCSIERFAVNVLLNGCDLCVVRDNRIFRHYSYGILELSASTFGSQNNIHHNDILNGALSTSIHIKTTARHARIFDNYLEQSSGSCLGFIDASNADAPSYGGNVSAARLTSIIEGNRIDGRSRATGFIYRYQPAGQQYGSIIDVGDSGPAVSAVALLLCDSAGVQVDEVPFTLNPSNACEYRFAGAKFGVWDGYQTNTMQASEWDGTNLLAFGIGAINTAGANTYLRARGRSIMLKNGFTNTVDLPFVINQGRFVAGHRYVLEIEARALTGTETLYLAPAMAGVEPGNSQLGLTTEMQWLSFDFVATSDATQTNIHLRRVTNNGSDIEIRRIRLRKVYQIEVPRTVTNSLVFNIPALTGTIDVRADGSGSALPALRSYRLLHGRLLEVGAFASDATAIDITASQSGKAITFTVTGAGAGKGLYVGYSP